MPSDYDAPPETLAALRKEQVRHGNLMAAGPGTPWEDRGAIGGFAAFFKTAFASMFSPRILLHSIRRPETPNDARVFVIITGVFWALGWVIQDYVRFLSIKDPRRASFDIVEHGYPMIAHAILAMAGTWFLFRMLAGLYFTLVSSGDRIQRTPFVLSYNVLAYCLGPSLLAVIPFYIGPVAAGVWIFCLFVFASVNRLAVKPWNAFVCVALAFAGIIGGAVLMYHGVVWLLAWLGYF